MTTTEKTKRTVSPETRAKLSAAGMGKRLSPETRAKISEAKKGRKHSPEVRARLSEANKGKQAPPETLERLRRFRDKFCHAGVDHPKAKGWHFRSPRGVVIRGKNLRVLVEAHADLFEEEDLEPAGRYGRCRAETGLRRLTPRRKIANGSWKGWTWVLDPEFEDHLEKVLKEW
jgi:hypothetical protein